MKASSLSIRLFDKISYEKGTGHTNARSSFDVQFDNLYSTGVLEIRQQEI